MTNERAVEILKTICGDCRLFPKCAYKKSECFTALDMAIDALSNTPNTPNALEALDITDKQIDMAIGAIMYMLITGYQSEDMEDALNSVIKVLVEVKEEREMKLFKDRKALAEEAERWLEENHVVKSPLSVISFLAAKGWLKQSAQPEQRWIPCCERLPKVGQDVLLSVAGKFPYIAEGCLREDGYWTQFRRSTILSQVNVTAWMPLPEPWRGEQDE